VIGRNSDQLKREVVISNKHFKLSTFGVTMAATLNDENNKQNLIK
jgi:hypothetical protein